MRCGRFIKHSMRQISIVSLLLIFMISCNNDDLKAPIPAYLSINDIIVKENGGNNAVSDNITDAKVFINNQSLGSYELPATIPIQNLGAVNLKIRAGIFNNGISNSRADYPFYTTYEVDTVFDAEGEITINPTVEYFSTVDFDNPWSGEDFESGANFEYHPNSDTVFVRTTDPLQVFEGSASGMVFLTEDQDFFEARVPTFTDIPRNGTPVYMEFDYQSDLDIALSVYANGQTFNTSIVFLRSQNNWTKVYIELGPVFSTLSAARDYNLAIGFVKEKGAESTFLIDNVKLAHF